MNLRRVKNSTGNECASMPENIHKRIHIVYFVFKYLLFVLVLLTVYVFVTDFIPSLPEKGSEESPFLMHQYCGTFFVEINRDNSFASPEDYSAYLEKYNSSESHERGSLASAVVTTAAGLAVLAVLAVLEKKKKYPRFLDNRYFKTLAAGAAVFIMFHSASMAALSVIIVLLFLAFRNADRNDVFNGATSDYLIISGVIWLILYIASEVPVIIHTAEQGDGMTGVFSEPVYYCQIYRLFAIQLIIICAGLTLRRHELNLKKAGTGINSKIIKGVCAVIAVTAAVFVAVRFGIRTYELIKVMSGEAYTVKLPFTVMDSRYSKLIDLPYELAKSPQVYKNTVLFRYIKDFPMFLLPGTAVILFVRMMLSVSEGNLNTYENRKRLNIAMIVLAVSSLWFNLMGIKELDLFNNGFTGIYGEVVYTIALRSLTEPFIFAAVLWFFKTYLLAIPEERAARMNNEEMTESE